MAEILAAVSRRHFPPLSGDERKVIVFPLHGQHLLAAHSIQNPEVDEEGQVLAWVFDNCVGSFLGAFVFQAPGKSQLDLRGASVINCW
jgi:hypothetical protein